MTLYLYALADERPPPKASLGRGMARRPLSVVAVGRLFAVVEEAEAPPITTRHVLAHDRVVRRLARVFRALLPMRFGSTVTGRRTLRELVAPRVADLEAAMDRVRDAVQFTLRVRGRRARRPKPPAGAGPGTRWLAERVAAGQIPEAASVLEATRDLVRASRAARGAAGSELGTVYQLVAKSDVRAWRRRLADGIAKLPRGVTVSVTGPWPAYAFVEAT